MALQSTDVPVTMRFTGQGFSNPTSAVSVSLFQGEDTISYESASFSRDVDVSGYGVRATFIFRLPRGSELPQSAVLFDTFDEENQVSLDLANLAVE